MIHISAAHIPGHVNAKADKLSRNNKNDLERSIDLSKDSMHLYRDEN